MVAEFPGAVEAINCAVEIQQEMDERNEPVPQDGASSSASASTSAT